jgi:hypothetical protein
LRFKSKFLKKKFIFIKKNIFKKMLKQCKRLQRRGLLWNDIKYEK